MVILAFDTSGPAVSAAVLTENKLLSCLVQNAGKTHSSVILPMIDQALAYAGVSKEELDLLACVTGPGSYTGVRIGVSTAQGLGTALGIPVVPVPALETLQYPLQSFPGIVVPILDARAGQIYTAAYEGGTQVLPLQAVRREEYAGHLLDLGKPCLFCGDGVDVHFPYFASVLGNRAEKAPLHLNEIQASAAGEWALKHRDLADAAGNLRPVYLRLSQAERERNARLNGEKAGKEE